MQQTVFPTGRNNAMTTSTKQQDELDALKADLAALREDVGAIAASLRDFVNQAGQANNPAGDTEPDESQQAAEQEDQWQEFKRKLEETREHGQQTLQDVSEEVTRHPLASIAVAFGVGYITAKLFNLLSWK
jgi:ElaB/YqjD/DUF883 family membrane-anchored ribosome-binding protein